MALENERRFLLPALPAVLHPLPRTPINQHYMLAEIAKTFRVRSLGNKAYMALKGPRIEGKNPEFEYEIPFADFAPIVSLFCNAAEGIEKDRVEWAEPTPPQNVWEVDIFKNRLHGLFIAEIEAADTSTARLPHWLNGAVEITTLNAFNNAALVKTTQAEVQALIAKTFAELPRIKLG